MLNDPGEFRRCCAVLLLSAVVLGASAFTRGAEYDEQYTLFLTAGMPRPVWPSGEFSASLVVGIQSQHGDLVTIARDLRRTDVHPPLYFWAAALWRRLAGNSLPAVRLLSVGCSLVSLALVGILGQQIGVPPALAMLLTLGCYGFTYTGGVARGFALALVLNLGGMVCLLAAGRHKGRGLAAGVLFGAAAASNYLAVFTALAFGVALAAPSWRPGRWDAAGNASRGGFLGYAGRGVSPAAARGGSLDDVSRGVSPGAARGKSLGGAIIAAAMLGLLPFLALDLWFFSAQRDSRTGQFPPFHWIDSVERLARYAIANLFGGLPLYVSGTAARGVTGAGVAALALALPVLIGLRWRRIGTPFGRRLIACAATWPPLGLLALGLLYDNTPIELRYLSFTAPFIALLTAGAMATLPRAIPAVVLVVQAVAIVGLLSRPETMQPARATAVAAATAGGTVLLPYGNDGVGIVGAFADEAPPGLRMLVVRADASVDALRRRLEPYPRIALAALAEDRDSRVAVAVMRAALASPCWRLVAVRFNVTAYQHMCKAE